MLVARMWRQVCIQYDEFCIQNDEFCINTCEFWPVPLENFLKTHIGANGNAYGIQVCGFDLFC